MTSKDGSLREQAAKGSKWTAVSAAVGISMQLAQLVVLGRLLDPADFGLMAMMMVAIGLANAIADFGLGNYLVQVDRLSQNVLNTLLAVVFALSILMAGLVALSADIVAAYYKAPLLSSLLPWLSMAIVLTTLSQILFALLQRSYEFKAIAIGEIKSSVLAFVAMILLAYAGHGVWAMIVGQLVMGGARLIFFLPRSLRIWQSLSLKGNLKVIHAREFVFFQTSERTLNYIGWNLDKIIIGRLVGDVGLGLYTIAYQLMIKPYSVLNPIFNRVALPLFSSIKNDNDRIISGYLQILKFVALLSFPIYLFMSIASPGIIQLIMGEKWAASAPVLSILSVLGMFFAVGNTVGNLVLAKGKPQLAFYFNLVSLGVYLIAFGIGGKFGVVGVAWAFLLSCVVILYPLEFVLRYWLVGMGVRQYFQAMLHLFTAALVPLFLYAAGVQFYGNLPSPQWSFLWAGAGVIFFMSYVWIFEFTLLHSIKNLILKGK
jgi:O-antigen/teichoic acid export membrane protein